MTPNSKTLLAMVVLFQSCRNAFFFDTNKPDWGVSLDLPREKYGSIEPSEDAFATSPVGLVVADGVSACEFSSRFVAREVTIAFQLHRLNYFGKEKIAEPAVDPDAENLKKDIYARLGLFQTEVDQAAAKLLADRKPAVAAPDLATSTGYLSAWLANEGGAQKLVLQQVGAVLALVMELKKTAGGRFYYVPKFMTSPKLYKLHFAHVIMTGPKGTDQQFNVYKLDVVENDLVVVASDGLFNNLHLGFLTVAVNAMLANFESNRELQTEKLMPLVDVFAKVLEKKLWVVEEFFKNDRTFTLDDENNLAAAPAPKAGDKPVTANAIEKGKPDAFAPFVDKLLEQFKNVPKKDEAHLAKEVVEEANRRIENERKSFEAFFKCPVIKQLAVPTVMDQKGDLLNDCLRPVFENHLNANQDALNSFLDPSRAVQRAGVLAALASAFSRIKENYPAPGVIQAWKLKETPSPKASGVTDDITVVASVIRPLAEPTAGEVEAYRKLFSATGTIARQRLPAHVARYVAAKHPKKVRVSRI